MNIPQNLMYTKTHEWVRFLENGNARIGITDHAQEAMGDIVFVELPQEGDSFDAGDSIAVVESVKAVSDIYVPLGGTVVAVNEKLVDQPALINDECYDAWIAELEDVRDETLLTPEEYEELVSEEE
jgi:glycine cleavage system H protein